ncbi:MULTISPECIES: hypothetical protein [unclassified Microcoleus]|uniref:hypothetical protein n=1 Tax=unclassified Microcoleus TaxID=2642155 RepID=UPI0025F7201B|nr:MULTISPECIES: hypothetical protein [unclassified Microcoleus]
MRSSRSHAHNSGAAGFDIKHAIEDSTVLKKHLFKEGPPAPSTAPTTVNCQLSTKRALTGALPLQLPTVNCQLPSVNCQLSTVNCQLSPAF